jgi:hypothetical protein
MDTSAHTEWGDFATHDMVHMMSSPQLSSGVKKVSTGPDLPWAHTLEGSRASHPTARESDQVERLSKGQGAALKPKSSNSRQHFYSQYGLKEMRDESETRLL